MHRKQIKERKRNNSLWFLPDPAGPAGRKRDLRCFGEKSGSVTEMPGTLPLTQLQERVQIRVSLLPQWWAERGYTLLFPCTFVFQCARKSRSLSLQGQPDPALHPNTWLIFYNFRGSYFHKQTSVFFCFAFTYH